MKGHIANILKVLALTCLLFHPLIVSCKAKTLLVSLKDHYPHKYVVQPGDTLYDIAGKYLNKPWEWKRIWRDNPQIKNPSKLYPGSVITLQFHEGKPYLRVTRRGTYKISPHARPRPAQQAIPPIYLSDIRPFLNGSRVFDTDELKHSGYVIAYNGEHMVAGQNNEVYVKNLNIPKGELNYSFYRQGKPYVDTTKAPGDKGYILGYVGVYLGDGQLVRYGNPATLIVTDITQGVYIKDRVVPNNKADFDLYFEPQAPDVTVNGQIIGLLNDEAQVATNQVIAINKGKKDRMEPGDVIAIFEHRRVIIDPLNKGIIRKFWFFSKPPDPDHAKVLLPKERIGEAMIFRTFSHVSYALVVRSTRAIELKDIVTNP